MKKFFLIITFSVLTISWGQTMETEKISDNLSIELDSRIQNILSEKEKCETSPEPGLLPPVPRSSQFCDGRRIQIFYSKNRKDAEGKFEEAKLLYPELLPTFQFIAPDYRVKLGYFETQEKAEDTLKTIKVNFSSSLIVWEKFRCNLLDD